MSEENVKKLIEDAKNASYYTRELFGKEVYQKRFKPTYEGYITALCAVLETEDDEKTEHVRGSTQ